MSARVTIAVDGPESDLWHVAYDPRDDPPRALVHVELRGVRGAHLSLRADGGGDLAFALPSTIWWRLIREVAAAGARAGDAETGDGPDEEAAAVASPVLAADRRQVATALAAEYATRAGVLSAAVEQAIARGADPLTLVCSDALRGRLPLGSRERQRAQTLAEEGGDAAKGRGARVAEALRAAFGDDDAYAYAWLWESRSAALRGRSPWAALCDGEDATVVWLLGVLEGGAFA